MYGISIVYLRYLQHIIIYTSNIIKLSETRLIGLRGRKGFKTIVFLPRLLARRDMYVSVSPAVFLYMYLTEIGRKINSKTICRIKKTYLLLHIYTHVHVGACFSFWTFSH